jgi:signal transduction histidine kinase
MSEAASKILEKNIDRIMKIWEQRARQEVEAAPEQKTLALRNDLPGYLQKLAESLRLNRNQTPLQRHDALNEQGVLGKKHGRGRAESVNYTIDQLIFEYHILRQTVFEVLDESGALTVIARDIILDSIEQAVNDAATEFSDYLKNLQETLSHTLVHDLRSPLSIAMLSAQMIRGGPSEDDPLKKIRGRIVSNLARIDLMIYRLLDYSSIKAGQKVILKIEKMDVVELLETFARDFSFSGTRPFLLQAPVSLFGYWDVSGIASIVENLVTNAVKYGDMDSAITLRAEQTAGQVRISVHNQGKVIPITEQGAIFQQFRRIRTEEDQVGWGLGLMIVKSIAEVHGGTVSLDSLENRGTTFTVELPLDCRQSDRKPVPEI